MSCLDTASPKTPSELLLRVLLRDLNERGQECSAMSIMSVSANAKAWGSHYARGEMANRKYQEPRATYGKKSKKNSASSVPRYLRVSDPGYFYPIHQTPSEGLVPCGTFPEHPLLISFKTTTHTLMEVSCAVCFRPFQFSPRLDLTRLQPVALWKG